ncbi:MAG: hypothetical protein CUN57_01250, partial [Phototrophicales bacterium]
NDTVIARLGSTGFDIKARFGQITQVRYDSNGYIRTVSNPANETYTIDHDARGLLRSFELPNGLVSTFRYDNKGRLEFDGNSVGNSWTLSRIKTDDGYIAKMTTALGRTTEYEIQEQPDGSTQRMVRKPDGSESRRIIKIDGSREHILSDGTKITTEPRPDARFGMQSPMEGVTTI